MKQFLHFLSIAVLLVSLSGCAKLGLKNNYFSANSKNYELDKGVIFNYGKNQTGTYDLDLWLYSESVTFYEKGYQFEGIGNIIFLDLNTNTANEITTGSYVWSETRDTTNVVWAETYTNYNMANQNGGYYSATDAIVEIIQAGDTYDISFEMTLTNGETVKGNYTGKLTKVAYAQQKKNAKPYSKNTK